MSPAEENEICALINNELEERTDFQPRFCGTVSLTDTIFRIGKTMKLDKIAQWVELVRILLEVVKRWQNGEPPVWSLVNLALTIDGIQPAKVTASTSADASGVGTNSSSCQVKCPKCGNNFRLELPVQNAES